ncbi:MAG: hypothetical protein AA908_08780 [Chlorobi bacterium NICIL-2]|nr:MAG: hypothetical protein AA908_08780 [Chlorobi bacterium NICIL-2]
MAVVVVGVVGCGARGRTERLVVARRPGDATFVAAGADAVRRVAAFLATFLAAFAVREYVFAFAAPARVAALARRAAACFTVAVEEAFFAAACLVTAF